MKNAVSEMAIVDGKLMVKTLQSMKHDTTLPDLTEIEALVGERERRRGLVDRYRQAGFQAMSDKLWNESLAIGIEITKLTFEEKLNAYREKGYFVMKAPEWRGKLSGAETGLTFDLPYIIVTPNRKFAEHMDYQALYKVGIQNWVGDVPSRVLEAVEQIQVDTDLRVGQLAILFVALRSKVLELVADFVRQDPVLVADLGDHYVVLKMWGADLEPISLALLDTDLLEANK